MEGGLIGKTLKSVKKVNRGRKELVIIHNLPITVLTVLDQTKQLLLAKVSFSISYQNLGHVSQQSDTSPLKYLKLISVVLSTKLTFQY